VTVRYAVAAAFVVVVAALIAIRGAGYLGGRADGGPLRLELARDGALRYELDGDPVQVQDVGFRTVSPGVTVIGPTLAGGEPLEGARLTHDTGRGAVRLRARRRGVYYVFGGSVDYRRGQRRFQTTMGGACVAVRLKADCEGYDGPGEAEVVEMGGPARYKGARFEGATATFEKRAGVRLTFTNRARSGVDVTRLGGGAIGVDAAPGTFRIKPGGAHSVFLRLEGCGRLEELDADLDGDAGSIPLSVPIELTC
jgi:hypothetical protein